MPKYMSDTSTKRMAVRVESAMRGRQIIFYVGGTSLPAARSFFLGDLDIDAGVYLVGITLGITTSVNTLLVANINCNGGQMAVGRGTANSGGGVTVTTLIQVSSSSVIEWYGYCGVAAETNSTTKLWCFQII